MKIDFSKTGTAKRRLSATLFITLAAAVTLAAFSSCSTVKGLIGIPTWYPHSYSNGQGKFIQWTAAVPAVFNCKDAGLKDYRADLTNLRFGKADGLAVKFHSGANLTPYSENVDITVKLTAPDGSSKEFHGSSSVQDKGTMLIPYSDDLATWLCKTGVKVQISFRAFSSTTKDSGISYYDFDLPTGFETEYNGVK
jgi:hypothetical protein